MTKSSPKSKSKPKNNNNRIITIFIEIISVVFAVLVALGVDQWWEKRENVELASKLKTEIEGEIQKNLVETEKTHDNYTSTFDTIMVYLEGPDSLLLDIKLNIELAILTSATWNTAQMLRATHYMDYDWVIEVATQYELQSIYLESQKQFLDVLGKLAEEQAGDNPRKLFNSLVGRLFVLNSLQDGLIEGYNDLLNFDQ